MHVSSLVTVPVFLIGIGTWAVSAKADCPCSGSASQQVCFTYSQFGHRALNGSNSYVRVVMYNGGSAIDQAVIPPNGSYQMSVGVNFSSCTADYTR